MDQIPTHIVTDCILPYLSFDVIHEFYCGSYQRFFTCHPTHLLSYIPTLLAIDKDNVKLLEVLVNLGAYSEDRVFSLERVYRICFWSSKQRCLEYLFPRFVDLNSMLVDYKQQLLVSLEDVNRRYDMGDLSKYGIYIDIFENNIRSSFLSKNEDPTPLDEFVANYRSKINLHPCFAKHQPATIASYRRYYNQHHDDVYFQAVTRTGIFASIRKLCMLCLIDEDALDKIRIFLEHGVVLDHQWKTIESCLSSKTSYGQEVYQGLLHRHPTLCIHLSSYPIQDGAIINQISKVRSTLDGKMLL